MKLTLISPRIALQKGDFLGSGVPYWPVELVTFAAYLREQRGREHGETITLIDLFGNNPQHLEDAGDHYLQGQPLAFHLDRHELKQTEAFVLYAMSYMSHLELLSMVRQLKAAFPKTPVAILENSQAVTAYSLQRMAKPFFEAGADLLICGEPYFNWDDIKQFILSKEGQPSNVIVPATINMAPHRITDRQARYPIPAWDLVNLEGYWSLPYSHGPKTKRFLPVLTSRGCPWPCDFCVVPETNDKRWRGNDAEAVVNELITLRDRFGVNDFQVEDLNPTVRHERWEKICELLIEREANIRFYFVSGTKAETVRIEHVPLLAKGGCRYISISPESGGAALMKNIGKKFNYEHGLRLVEVCREQGIRTQACFLVGHPDETEADFVFSNRYLADMVKAGLDEVAVFVVAPFAGSQLYARDQIALSNSNALPSFSPKGRAGYETLERRRGMLIKTFFKGKLLRGLDLWVQGLRALFGTPQTKMENLPRRILYIYWLVLKQRFSKA